MRVFTFLQSRGAAAQRIGINLFSTLTEHDTKRTIQFANMSSKHLKRGDPLPPFNGKLRVYNMRFCPYAQRTILVLNAKKIPYEVINVNLIEKPEWLALKSPLEKVPAIEIADGVTVHESLITADYLEDAYPQRPITSKDPLQKAKDKLIVEHFNSVITIFLRSIFKPETIDDNAVDSYFSGIELIQSELKSRGKKFLFGDEPGMPDYMIWPWIERLETLSILTGGRFKIDKSRFALLMTWIENMIEDPAIKDYLLEPEYHLKYVHMRLAGNSDFDMSLPNKL